MIGSWEKPLHLRNIVAIPRRLGPLGTVAGIHFNWKVGQHVADIIFSVFTADDGWTGVIKALSEVLAH